jgi:hypothetical protein
MRCLALLVFHQTTNVHFDIRGGNCQSLCKCLSVGLLLNFDLKCFIFENDCSQT